MLKQMDNLSVCPHNHEKSQHSQIIHPKTRESESNILPSTLESIIDTDVIHLRRLVQCMTSEYNGKTSPVSRSTNEIPPHHILERANESRRMLKSIRRRIMEKNSKLNDTKRKENITSICSSENMEIEQSRVEVKEENDDLCTNDKQLLIELQTLVERAFFSAQKQADSLISTTNEKNGNNSYEKKMYLIDDIFFGSEDEESDDEIDSSNSKEVIDKVYFASDSEECSHGSSGDEAYFST